MILEHLILSYNVLGNQKECQEWCTDQYCLPIPLHQECNDKLCQVSNIGVFNTQEKKIHTVQYLTPWWTFPQTDFMTDTISVFFVKFAIPRNPFSCWRAMVMAAPAMNPMMAAWDKNSMINPSLWQCSVTDYINCSCQETRRTDKLRTTRRHWPEESKRCLSDSCEERRGERQPLVLQWVGLRVNLIPEESTEQQRNHSHWADGYIPGAAHHRIYQRWDKAAVCKNGDHTSLINIVGGSDLN